MDQDKIGKFIKDIRKQNNLTQAQLANKLGVTYQAVSKWENGKNIPDIAILKQISEMFDVNIDEIISGEKINKKNNKKKFVILLIIGCILLVGIFLVFHQHDDFEFKTITTTCHEFNISGSAAYNNDKTSIYISNVEFCGKDDKTVYSSLECTLYESYNDNETKISSCSKKKNLTLEDYLKEVKIQVDDYSSTCKEFSHSNLYLEINASDKDNKTTTYTVPLKLNDNCSK